MKSASIFCNTSSASSRFALFQQVQEPSCITIGIANDGVSCQVVKVQSIKCFFLCSFQQKLQTHLLSRFQYIDLSTRQQGRVHLKRWVLSRCTYESDQATFCIGKKSILLGLIESVNFIYEQNGCASP